MVDLDTKMRVAGLIVAGGRAARMGADKPFARFRDSYLLDAVVSRVLPQVKTLMLNVRSEHVALCKAHYGEKFTLLPDAFGGEAGPLGGVVAGLQMLPSLNTRWLATFPCDTPFLPEDIVAELQAAAKPSANVPVVAVAMGKVQSLCALWPYECLEALRNGVISGNFHSVWWALDRLQANPVEIAGEPHSFFNVNTAEELAEAETLMNGDGRT